MGSVYIGYLYSTGPVRTLASTGKVPQELLINVSTCGEESLLKVKLCS